MCIRMAKTDKDTKKTIKELKQEKYKLDKCVKSDNLALKGLEPVIL